MHSKKGFYFFILIILWRLPSFAQDTALTIETCYNLARQNYPLIQKQDLIKRSSNYSIQNISKLYLPQLSVSGQASYQSETIDFPDVLSGIPGVAFPELSKDQYKIQAEINQQIYDGGTGKLQKASGRAAEAVQQQSLEVGLYALRERVTQIYFSILLMDEQLKQNEIRKSDLESAASKAQGAYENGTAYKSNVDELKAEILNTDMITTELRANRKAYMHMLLILTGQDDDNLRLAMPDQKVQENIIKRPELSLYDLQKKSFDIQEKQLQADYTPKLSAFVQAAYGRPTLNIIENKFGPWFMGGVRLNWAFGSLYTLKNNKNLLAINRQTVDIDKETFLFNTNLTLTRQNGEISKYLELIKQDDEAIALRKSVKQSAEAQLENGVITTHDFISQINAENLARQSRILHTIQLLQAQYNYQNTSGN